MSDLAAELKASLLKASLSRSGGPARPWAVILPSGNLSTYEHEDDARDAVATVRDTDSPECELRHFENGEWVVVDPMGDTDAR